MRTAPILINRNQPVSRRELTLCSSQAPGDILAMTACVRDLKKSHPYLNINVQTRHAEIWMNNPYVKVLPTHATAPNKVLFDYRPYINASNNQPGHFIGALHKILEKLYSISVPVTEFKPEVFLSDAEKNTRPVDEPYWVIVCGGKSDYTVKWWNPDHAQKVVDHFKGKFKFVQVGKSSDPGEQPIHVHFPLNDVVNMQGKTGLRDLIRLVYHSEGVLCPITFFMHLAAAVPRRPNELRNKPCVVIAGGREAPHWETYPGHQFLHTIGQLSCCATRACWARRAQLVEDTTAWNSSELCSQPLQIRPDLRIARCMDMISAKKVIETIEAYYSHYTPMTINSQAVIA